MTSANPKTFAASERAWPRGLHFEHVPGAVASEHAARNVAALQMAIPDDLWIALKSAGVLREGAPTPGRAGPPAPAELPRCGVMGVVYVRRQLPTQRGGVPIGGGIA